MGIHPCQRLLVLKMASQLTLMALNHHQKKELTKRNDKQDKCEYLWSHPQYTKGGGRQTHCPIIIQQDRQFLTELRRG